MTARVLVRSVGDAVSLLDSDFQDFAEGFKSRRYALWVGSGISRGVAPDLRKLLLKVLNFLHMQINTGDPSGKYSEALSEVFRKADLNIESELSPADRLLPPEEWPNIERLLTKFQANYSKILDIRIAGVDDDHLLWDGTEFTTTFVNGARPDTEHLCLAVLIMEGVVADIASANWDNYIESAVDEISAGRWKELGVKVLPSDFREVPTAANLYKFHGCAISAKEDPATYRRYLVGRQEQITGWPHEDHNKTMKRQLLSLAVSHRTLMIGLSAQDSDIQSLFSEASRDQQWDWPIQPPALVFSEENLGSFQEDVLKSAYRGSYSAHASDINASAHFSSYGKPLLTALVLTTLADKFRAALVHGLHGWLPQHDLESLASALLEWRTQVADYCGDGRKDRVSTVIHSLAQLTSVSRQGVVGPQNAPGYAPYSVLPANKINIEPTLITGGNPQLALSLAILARGQSANEWVISFDKLRRDGMLTVETGSGKVQAVLVANEMAMIEAVKNGVADLNDPDVVFVSGQTVASERQRSPKSAPGRSRNAGARIVGLSKLLAQANSAPELHLLFRQGAAL